MSISILFNQAVHAKLNGITWSMRHSLHKAQDATLQLQLSTPQLSLAVTQQILTATHLPMLEGWNPESS